MKLKISAIKTLQIKEHNHDIFLIIVNLFQVKIMTKYEK